MAMASTSATTPDVKATVLQLLKTLKPPAHVASLSFAYKAKTGNSIKQDYKGGMLRFLKVECADTTVLVGEGNDTFIRVATPRSRA